jgi:hypothetical protein
VRNKNIMEDKYQIFLNYLFEREESKGDWRCNLFGLEIMGANEPKLTADEVVEFIRRMLENYDSDLAKYSDWQLSLGLDYVFNDLYSKWPFLLRDGSSHIENRVTAIRALKILFQKCLNNRCSQTLGHLSEEGSQLNNFCYMFWDITPLIYCEKTKEKDAIYAAVAEVMEFSLSLDNIACVESGLHGLGHLGAFYKEAPKIIRRFIETQHHVDKRLIEYAKEAEVGDIQ